MSEITKTLTDDMFENEVLKSQKPVLVDFWAPWCGPCRMIAPIVEEFANDNADKISVGKLDIDGNEQTAAKYGVTTIPTLIIFKNGEVVDKSVGSISMEQLEDFVEKNI